MAIVLGPAGLSRALECLTPTGAIPLRIGPKACWTIAISAPVPPLMATRNRKAKLFLSATERRPDVNPFRAQRLWRASAVLIPTEFRHGPARSIANELLFLPVLFIVQGFKAGEATMWAVIIRSH